MTDHSLRDLLHAATHHVPGVPAHVDQQAGHQGGPQGGHQGAVHHGHAPRNPGVRNHGRNHSPARPPRVLVAWQNRIAAFFGQEV
jgi:hypothetical protein